MFKFLLIVLVVQETFRTIAFNIVVYHLVLLAAMGFDHAITHLIILNILDIVDQQLVNIFVFELVLPTDEILQQYLNEILFKFND